MGFFASSGILNRKGFFGGGFDPDASAFFATAGVTDQTARGQINAFVLGIKNLGLYSSMVCWPLRSTQNAGTGTTAYSLGGFGTYDGTLANSPAWGIDGVTFSPTNSCLQFSYLLPTGTHTILAVGLNNTTIANSQIFRVSNTANNFHFWQRRNGTFSFLFSPNTDLSGFINGAITNTATANIYNSFAATTSRTFAGGISHGGPAFFGDLANNQQWGSVGSFAAIFNTTLTTAQILALHNLLKTTLCQGLGLP
jgi:hypothetical protein